MMELKGLTGCIANCIDCDWKETGHLIAEQKAKQHSKKFKHLIEIEMTYCFMYKEID